MIQIVLYQIIIFYNIIILFFNIIYFIIINVFIDAKKLNLYIYEKRYLFFNINIISKIYWSRFSYYCVVGAGAGIGIVFAGLVLAVSRNPYKEARLIQLALLGFALAEAMGLLAIMMAFLILYSYILVS